MEVDRIIDGHVFYLLRSKKGYRNKEVIFYYSPEIKRAYYLFLVGLGTMVTFLSYLNISHTSLGEKFRNNVPSNRNYLFPNGQVFFSSNEWRTVIEFLNLWIDVLTLELENAKTSQDCSTLADKILDIHDQKMTIQIVVDLISQESFVESNLQDYSS